MSLAGARVVVTRAERKAGDLERVLVERGADVVRMPVIVIKEPSSSEHLDRGLGRLREHEYDWVVFGSVNAVKAVFRRSQLAAEALRGVKVAAVGPATAAELGRAGVEPSLVPAEHTVEAVAEGLGRGPGKVLFPRVEDGPGLPEAFAANGWRIEQVAAYRNVPAPRGPAHEIVEDGAFDAITFLSPSAIDAFTGSVRWHGLGLARREERSRIVACIGPTTAARAREHGLRVDAMPAEHTVSALVEALDVAWRSHA